MNILGYLKNLVKEHLQLFKDVFSRNITPKQHYLVHLPSQIVKSGLLVRVWAMRFEAKHQQFKQILKVTKTFKNLPKTLSGRHQSGVCTDAIPLTEEKIPSDHPICRRDLVFEHGSTHTRALCGTDRDTAESYIEVLFHL